jgi:hypothetical protein
VHPGAAEDTNADRHLLLRPPEHRVGGSSTPSPDRMVGLASIRPPTGAARGRASLGQRAASLAVASLAVAALVFVAVVVVELAALALVPATASAAALLLPKSSSAQVGAVAWPVGILGLSTESVLPPGPSLAAAA